MTGPVRDLIERFDELLARPVSMRSIGLVRMLVGAIAVRHLWPIAVAAVRGDTYHDRFHHAYASWYPDLPPAAYALVLVTGVAAAGAMCVGLLSRLATAVTLSVVGYHLFLSTTHVHNNRAYLFGVLVALALAPSGRALSVDEWRRRRRGEPPSGPAPAWPLWLLRFLCSLVYGASGISKLVDPDWFGGTVTWLRVVRQEATVRASVLPDVVVDLLVDRSFHSLAAKWIVLTELFIAVGLWWPRTRPWAVATAVVFHVLIELSARVQIFSYLGIAVLVVWADPALPRLRRPRRAGRSTAEPAAIPRVSA